MFKTPGHRRARGSTGAHISPCQDTQEQNVRVASEAILPCRGMLWRHGLEAFVAVLLHSQEAYVIQTLIISPISFKRHN